MSGDLSIRASISIVAAAAVVATAFVVLTWPDSNDGSPLTADQGTVAATAAVTPTPTPSPTASSTPSSTPVVPVTVPGVDLEFPKVAGDWRLESVTLKRDIEGRFGGVGVIEYTGKTRATGSFTLVVFSGGRQIAILRGATSQAKPNTSTTVSWVSADPWAEEYDGYTFTAN